MKRFFHKLYISFVAFVIKHAYGKHIPNFDKATNFKIISDYEEIKNFDFLQNKDYTFAVVLLRDRTSKVFIDINKFVIQEVFPENKVITNYTKIPYYTNIQYILVGKNN